MEGDQKDNDVKDEGPTCVLDASPECIARMKRGRPSKEDFTVTAVRIKSMNEKYLVLGWETQGAGFGELSLYKDGDSYELDTECMGREFCIAVFTKLVDDCLNDCLNKRPEDT